MATPGSTNIKQAVGSFGYNETDNKWYPIKVDSDGSIAIDFDPVVDTPEYFEDTNFVTGDSPVTLDINTALGRNATTTTVLNDGPGEFTVEYSADGAAFGDAITVKQREQLRLREVSVDSIRITWVADSAYRVIAI
jgi:hypothetical protein